MSTTITFTNNTTITSGSDIDLPSNAPDIDQVVSAQIIRTRNSFDVDDHAGADIAAGVSVDDHATADIATSIDDQTLDTQVAVGGAVTNALGHDNSSPAQLETASGSNVNMEAISSHASSTPLSHANSAGSAVAHATSAASGNPIISATATKVDIDTITLNIDFEAGDLLQLTYLEVGTRVQVS